MPVVATEARKGVAQVKCGQNLTHVNAGGFDRCGYCNGDFRKEQAMLDLILVVGTLVIFVLSIGYAYACDRL